MEAAVVRTTYPYSSDADAHADHMTRRALHRGKCKQHARFSCSNERPFGHLTYNGCGFPFIYSGRLIIGRAVHKLVRVGSLQSILCVIAVRPMRSFIIQYIVPTQTQTGRQSRGSAPPINYSNIIYKCIHRAAHPLN